MSSHVHSLNNLCWQINEVLSESGKVQGRIEVTLNTGTSFCYLSTTDMSIHYLTPAQNVVDGNLARMQTALKFNTILIFTMSL